MKVFYCFIGILALLVLPAARAAAQRSSQSLRGPAMLACSPAPCILPPTQASPGPNNAVDAPIVADPSNPRNIIVGSNDANCGYEGAESPGFFVSLDGGSAWNQVCMSSRFFDGQEYIPVDGPILGYDRNGVAYIAGYYASTGDGVDLGAGEAFEKSNDGVTWSAPAPAVLGQNSGPDYCGMTVDTSALSPYIDSVYISCVMINVRGLNQVAVSHSNDGGATWHLVNVAPAQNGSRAEDLNTAVTTGRDGTVYVTWMYCYSFPYQCNNDKAYMMFSKSRDGGNTWTTPTVTATVLLNHGNIPNTHAGAVNTPAIGVDNSGGPYAGNLYVVMYNWTGTFMQVQVVRSTDGGNTWSKPVPVAPGITHDQFFPWIAVSPTGLVGVSWLDRRNDPANVRYQAFAGISNDGGLSFEPNVQLTTAFSDPNTDNGPFGAYDGATWDGPNYFLAAWMDQSNDVNTQVVVGGIRLK